MLGQHQWKITPCRNWTFWIIFKQNGPNQFLWICHTAGWIILPTYVIKVEDCFDFLNFLGNNLVFVQEIHLTFCKIKTDPTNKYFPMIWALEKIVHDWDAEVVLCRQEIEMKAPCFTFRELAFHSLSSFGSSLYATLDL